MTTVAEAAGVSVATVSRVLAGSSEISAETRERVQEAVRATGYRARHRATGGVIDILVDTAAPGAGELIGGAEQAAFEFGHTLTVSSTGQARFRIADWVDKRRCRPPHGVVLVPARIGARAIALMRTLPGPLVLLDLCQPAAGSDLPQPGTGSDLPQPGTGAPPDLPTVGATNWAGALAATRHLLRLGHTRIGFIGGPEHLRCAWERHEGYLAAHREHGVACDPGLARHRRRR